MSIRSVIPIAIVLLASQGCVTGTAHMLPVAGNPLRAQAEACELTCQKLLGPTPKSTLCQQQRMGGETSCAPTPPDRDSYASCLDSCPGARSIDAASCPDPPLPGVICEKTYRANLGGIIGGTVAVAAVAVLVVLLHSLAGGNL